MNYRFKLNLDKLVTLTGYTPFGFLNITDITNSTAPSSEGLYMDIDYVYNQYHLTFTYKDAQDQTQVLALWGSADVKGFSLTDTYITFSADMTENYLAYQGVIEMIGEGVIEVLQDEDDQYVSCVTYLQNSENDKLDKSLTAVGLMAGVFNHAIGLKSIDIDIKGYAMDYNYVYIPRVKRYYYVDSVELISADISRLHLKEDVLMSHKDLIRSQTAYIERQENVYDDDLIDEMVKYSYDKSVLSFAVTLSNDIFTNTDNDDLDFVVETVG